MTQIEKEKAAEAGRKEKFHAFDRKSSAKNDWYMKNIIQPQIEKHLDNFEKEKAYDQNYNDRKVKQESQEVQKKKKMEQDVFA